MCVCLQEVCYQYWPSRGSQTHGEFTVELLGEEKQSGFVLRSLAIRNNKVATHVYSHNYVCVCILYILCPSLVRVSK